ncbi:MAG: hypothetical protein JW871_07220 [Endomicrobiales bacterium]|nr:hypothetical protein [Endomicrobiales bacterium]
MKPAIRIIPFLVVCFFISSCGPSYPKDKLAESLKGVLKKEYDIDGEVELKEKTLYLDIILTGLTTTEPKALSDVLKTVQKAMLTITRVSLSSDAQVEYMVVNARDPGWKLSLRIVQRLEDVKWLIYHKISRSDYEGRMVLEIDRGSDMFRDTEGEVFSDDFSVEEEHTEITESEHKKISIEEFIGRLIASQVNMLNLKNPFLSVFLNNPQLKFQSFSSDEIVISVNNYLNESSLLLFKKILEREARKVVSKYDELWSPKRIIIEGKNNQIIYLDLATAEF